MTRTLVLLFVFFATRIYASDISIQKSRPFKSNHKNVYPIQLVASDSFQIIYTQGNEKKSTQEVLFANQKFRTTKKIILKTKPQERADNFIWTGEKLIILWEKKVKNDRLLSYQLISKNGRRTSVSNLIQLPNCFSPYLKDHNVEIIYSPNKQYAAFIIQDFVLKKNSKKNPQFTEYLVIFDRNGQILEKQKNSSDRFDKISGVYFLTDQGELLKFKSENAQKQIRVDKKNLTNKEKEVITFHTDLPDSVQVLSYQIHFNSTTDTYDYLAKIKTNDTVTGQNGLLSMKLNLEKDSVQNAQFTLYSPAFLSAFQNNKKFSEGQVIYPDLSLGEQFITRKVCFNASGGTFYVQEFYNQSYPKILNENTDKEYPERNSYRFTQDYNIQSSYNMLDFIVTYINPQGKIEWSIRIPKEQLGLGYQFGSFDAFARDSSLYLFYNTELPGNSFLKTMNLTRIDMDKVIPILVTVQGDATYQKKDIRPLLDEGLIFFPWFSNALPANWRLPFRMLLQLNTAKSPSQAEWIEVRPSSK